jgi:putative tryptophan/tyrosine transport system substrate-binding protein
VLRERADSLYTDATVTILLRHEIVAFADQYRLPLVSASRLLVEAGGLLSYNANPFDLFRRAPIFADRIFRGTKPSDLPVEQATKFELVINLKTAKALGLTIPQTVLLRADQIIE